MSTSERTKELKDRLEKSRALARRHKKDDTVGAIILMLELVIELHERIDELGSRLARVESRPTPGPDD